MTIPIRLRALEKSDLPILNKWRNLPALISTLGANFAYIPETVDERWYDHYLAHRESALRLSIIVEDSGEYIGNANLTSIHPVNRTAEFSLMIGDERFHKKGIGTSATLAVLAHGFSDLGLNRIYLNVLSHHQAAIALYRKCGFVHEGIKREEVFKDGTFHDMCIMAILQRDHTEMSVRGAR
jgi:diamine N-acetyltransferase